MVGRWWWWSTAAALARLDGATDGAAFRQVLNQVVKLIEEQPVAAVFVCSDQLSEALRVGLQLLNPVHGFSRWWC
jgi:hypothetical protein